MTNTKNTTTTSKETTQKSTFNCPCGNIEGMSAMQQNCCGSDTGSFDWSAMMQQMCGGTPKETQKQ